MSIIIRKDHLCLLNQPLTFFFSNREYNFRNMGKALPIGYDILNKIDGYMRFFPFSIPFAIFRATVFTSCEGKGKGVLLFPVALSKKSVRVATG